MATTNHSFSASSPSDVAAAPSLIAGVAASSQAAGQAARAVWYFALARALEWQAARHGEVPRYKPVRPVPTQRELLADLGQLLVADAAHVRAGLYPAMSDTVDGPLEHGRRISAMFADLPSALARRDAEDAGSVKAAAASTDGMPDYFTQDFHFQTGGYLTEESARLYDVQVETLFVGSAGPMRRSALAAVARHLRGRDQRQLALLDVACGTGRFLRQVRLAFPRLALTGLDLSQPYLKEAARQLDGLRPATLLAANAEKMPLATASQDIVTTTFLFHELPPDVRRTVTREIARVLKPGGLFVFLDSLQMGDKPGWDGLLEAFPVRFHEPYYRHYAIDDLDRLFSDAGLMPKSMETPFLAKLLVRVRA
jgi:ubiquinone/menaquinone biosynthesis C-methylase UbiE